MKAKVIKEFGGAEAFQTMELEIPKISVDEVLVKVSATSVNPVDLLLANGGVPSLVPTLPAVLHEDFSGVIEKVGSNVSDFQPGQKVYGCGGGLVGIQGALAEYMSVDARLLAKAPDKISLVEAAVLPLVAITAYDALIDRANVKSGQTVLIHGGAGGVGHIAIQLAKWKGARVMATAGSEEKVKIVKQLGADAVYNYHDDNFQNHWQEFTNGRGFDIVFDTVGGKILEQSIDAAKLHGTVVTINSLSAPNLGNLHMKALTLHGVFMLTPLIHNVGRARHGEILKVIAELVDAGKIKPLIHSEKFTLDTVSSAHEAAMDGNKVGKILVTVAE